MISKITQNILEKLHALSAGPYVFPVFIPIKLIEQLIDKQVAIGKQHIYNRCLVKYR